MKIKHIITAMLCLVVTSNFAQNIEGIILSTKGNPVPFANIMILNSSQGTATDLDGRFALKLNSGTYQIQFSAIGFAPKIKNIVVTNDKLSLNVTLVDQTESLGEVLVTSNKIETDLQKTPLAATALNAKQLKEYRVWSISDLTALAPSAFTIEHGNSTGSNFLNFRGAMGFTNEQSVATYVDGVYQFDFYSAPLNFNNIERVEILRGPQGTLYGRNAFAGVLNVITKKPTNKTTGFVEVDLGNYEQQRYSLGFNTPLIQDKLFVNAGLQLNKRGAVYENPTLNTKDFDGKEAYSGNLNLKYIVSDKWTLDFTSRYENNTDKGAYPWVTTDSIALNEPYKAFGNYDNTEKRTNFNASISAKYYGEKFNFTSITAFLDYENWFDDKYDFDFTASKLISGDTWNKQNQITQEFRFTSPANESKLNWTVGSYLFLDKAKSNYTTYYEEDFALFDPTAPYSTITNGVKNNVGIAFFGQGNYAITPKLDVTVGARYDIEHRKLTQNSSYEKDDVVTILSTDSSDDKTFYAFTPKFILNYQLTDNSILYGSYAKGFRIGGFNFGNDTNPTYDPERSDNYDIGIKNNLWSNKLKVNLTAFYFQQKDQQLTTTTDGAVYATQNIGDMDNYGLELEVSILPIKNLQIDWTASTSHSEYKKLELFDANSFTTIDYKGNQAIYTPKYQSMVAAQYSVPFPKSKHNISAFVRGEFKYIGEYQLDFENSNSQDAYSLINTRFGISSNHLDLAFWVRNLTDERYLSWGYGSYMLGSPRMWGVTLTAKL
ncbi:TonB-dependent receptor [Winogradskyella psychrotolerans]|uniref:TonB-dependent receptor n=1 Tax=Winogradskyella psychrotolerans TaxID=1344585 RepID=UPI001C07D9D5|nr:TonB-dependent receptor [Winogradskyella psychrotolerans]